MTFVKSLSKFAANTKLAAATTIPGAAAGPDKAVNSVL